MLTLEEAIKPILKDEAVDGYGPVCAYEGKYHLFVGFGFDGKMAPGNTPYFIRHEEPSPIELEMREAKEVPVP